MLNQVESGSLPPDTTCDDCDDLDALFEFLEFVCSFTVPDYLVAAHFGLHKVQFTFLPLFYVISDPSCFDSEIYNTTSSDSAMNVINLPLAEASRQAIRLDEDQVSSSLDIPPTDISILPFETSQDDPAVLSPHLFFPLPISVAGKSGITLLQVLTEAGSTMSTPPDIATAEMVVAGTLSCIFIQSCVKQIS